jgi:hypothetical protein
LAILILILGSLFELIAIIEEEVEEL